MSAMKVLLCVFLFICISFASNVNRIGQRGNVLFFEMEGELTENDHKKPERMDANVAYSACENPAYFCSNNRTCCKQIPPSPYPYACCPFVKNVPSMKYQSKEVTAVQCPDGMSECLDGQTCCKTHQGNWACCPLPEAVCCSDGEHCCPSGYTCGEAGGLCNKGLSTIKGSLKQPAKSRVQALSSVICPGGSEECPDGNTCCQLSSGGWGCCPHPEAVCCSDHIHCCPNGYKCDVSAGTCTSGSYVMGLMMETPAKSLAQNVDSVICPDGKSECPDGNTCCKLSSGDYGCCPLPSAVCCSDGVHCCPSGYTCGAGGLCNKGLSTIKGSLKQPAKSRVQALSNVICPGGSEECPDGNTCCQLSSGGWGCCPHPEAVCCSDHIHCCPNGYKCDVSAGTCTSESNVIEWMMKTPAKSLAQNVDSVICPDGKSECPDGDTCCKLSSGDYGCCPLPSAVCCSDGVHCCPSGYTCSAGRMCNKGHSTIKGSLKQPAKSRVQALSSVICPGGSVECPDGNTCCQLSSGGWGCCPHPEAVCCSDHIHCCPNGYKCDVSAGTCTSESNVIDWMMKTPAKSLAQNVDNVICPDGKSECPDGNTCCRLSSGGYGCCPLPSAVCCSDGEHCCPAGFTCETGGMCNKGANVIKASVKQPAKSPVPSLTNVVCPGGSASCPYDFTCCKLSSGKWGCCPQPRAVCCSDGVHCCPSGYTCGSQGMCIKGADVIEWSVKQPAKSHVQPLTSVVCPGGQEECPDGNTCCKLATGNWGCCPLPQAVCCSDGVHCCPNGYTCGSQGKCTKGADVIEWLVKQPAKNRVQPLTSVVCPGGQEECPDGNTCCKLATGNWGCCPLPQAVCCSDGVHCCPNGYTCGSQGKCTKGADVIEWSVKQPAKSRVQPLSSVICPGGQEECPDGNTCCKLATGNWGCCPLPQAVCCSDGVHCCPNGYTCGSQGKCTKGADVIEWSVKQPAKSRVQPLSSVICPGGQEECPDGNTCCKLATGNWGCCPLPQAVCCSDGVHCCPNGYTCGSQGKCTKGADVIEWSVKQPAKSRVQPLSSVICPGGQEECPDGNTCCKLATGNWGCCPLPQAVCCSDGVHCCPNGYTCGSQGKCTKGADVIEWSVKQPAKSRVQPLSSVICPGGQEECPDGNTCCKLATGNWGCCPLPQAVCCSDGVHCCPNGYTCGSQGMCTKGADVIEWSVKQPAKSRVQPLSSVICPGGQGECPDGNTCCKLATGNWGCCPLPQAVCCSDGVHCCPNGYTCGSQGMCTKGADVIEWSVKQPAKSRVQPLSSVICPGGQGECPDGNTCCKLATGNWGCCPLPQAVCCSDGVHCCPNGYTCGSQGMCTKGADVIEWSVKQPAKSRVQPLTSVVCPGGQEECPDGNTCCKLATGNWGCCPLPQAVCCSDGVHCCPNGYTCGSQGKCTKGADVIEWSVKQPAKSRVQPLTSVVCPGGQEECPDGNTCCKMASGDWGCCPYPQATCCSDKKHCCPKSYTCDTSSGKCNNGDVEIKWQLKQLAQAIIPKVTSVICPDGTSQCPDGNTCCMMASGYWGCCPHPQAVCCSDHIHCCPNGYTCDVSAGTCNNGADVIEWLAKQPAKNV